MKWKIFLYIVLILGVISCKKEEIKDDNILVTNNSNIVFGDYSTVSKVVHLRGFLYNGGNDTIEMDIDSDSIIDVQIALKVDTIRSNPTNVLDLVKKISVSLIPMHANIFLESLEQNPIIYYSTRSDTFYTIGKNKDTTEVRIIGSQQQHCYVMNSFDSLVNIGPVVYMQFFSSADNFPEYSYWFNGPVEIQSLKKGDVFPGHGVDTSHYISINHTTCGTYNLDVSFFGIKLVKNGVVKYGWIRIDPSPYGIKGLEYALE